MQRLLGILRLDFIPRSPDFALLLLRLWLGLTMLFNHGFGKLFGFKEMVSSFPGLFGLGSAVSLGLAVFAEVVCSILLVGGLFARLAALNLAFTMGVAFFAVHKGALSGEHSGELAFIYLAGFATLLFAGGGRFSLDRKFFGRRHGYVRGAARVGYVTRERV